MNYSEPGAKYTVKEGGSVLARLRVDFTPISWTYTGVHLASLSAGLWWFLSGSALRVVTYVYGDDPRASLAFGQLTLASVSLFIVLVHYLFSQPALARKLNPRVVRVSARVSIVIAVSLSLVAGFIGLIGGIGLDSGTPFPWWQWFWAALVWVVPLLAVAVGSVAVSRAVAGHPASSAACFVSFLVALPLIMVLSPI